MSRRIFAFFLIGTCLTFGISNTAAGQSANSGIDGGAVYRQNLQAAIADAKAYATFMSRKGVSRYVPVLMRAYVDMGTLIDLYENVFEASTKENLEGYIEYFQNERVAKMQERSRSLQNKVLRIHQTLPDVNPIDVPLAAVFLCETALYIRREVSNAIGEMEQAELNLENRISELDSFIIQARKNRKIANVNSTNLEILATDGFPVVSVITLTTATSAKMLAEARQLSDLGNLYRAVEEEGGRLLGRFRDDLNTIQGNLNVLYDLERAECQERAGIAGHWAGLVNNNSAEFQIDISGGIVTGFYRQSGYAPQSIESANLSDNALGFDNYYDNWACKGRCTIRWTLNLVSKNTIQGTWRNGPMSGSFTMQRRQ